MILTNALDLPAAIVNAVANDPYDRGNADLSVSQLIAPPRKVELERRHADELVEDVSDRIWALMGQIAHGILERAETDALTETRLFIEMNDATGHPWKISGKFDRLACTHAVLGDWKVTSVWAVKDGGKIEWAQQLNIYAYMLRQSGYWVDKLENICILRDWRKSEALSYPGSYPSHQVKVIPAPMWTDGECLKFIAERVDVHRAARDVLPLCTDAERWGRPPVYAVMKNGNVRATKLCDSQEEAERYIADNSRAPKAALAPMRIEVRPGEFIRCSAYCSAAPFCEQYQGEQKGRLNLRPYSNGE